MTLNASLAVEIQKLAPSAIIELFEFDATSLGGDLLRFHAGTNSLSQNIVWQGNTYQRYPISIQGFEYNGQGQFPRPKLQVSNLLSAITTIILAHDDLLGAKVSRKRTLVKFLDAVNFPGGINVSADPTAAFEDDIYYVDRKSNEDRDSVEFELASAADLVNVMLPNRQVVQNVCVWKYRGAECGFTGAPLYDQNDQRLTTSTSAGGAAVLGAKSTLDAAQTAVDVALSNLNAASVAKDNAGNYVLHDRQINYNPSTDSGNYFVIVDPNFTEAVYGGVDVTLSDQYRRGPFYTSDVIAAGNTTAEIYYIEKWQIDSAALAAATTTYNSALTAYNSAVSTLASAQSAYDSTIAGLPSDDQLFSLDRCGKRLASCKLRFGTHSELPFGAFPSVGLIK